MPRAHLRVVVVLVVQEANAVAAKTHPRFRPQLVQNIAHYVYASNNTFTTCAIRPSYDAAGALYSLFAAGAAKL